MWNQTTTAAEYSQKLSLKTWWGVITPLNAIAVSLTLFRLYQRSSKRQLWWDDFMALISLLCGIVYMTTPYFKKSDLLPMPLTADQLHRRIIIWWLGVVFFPLVVWTARISIGLSILRLVPLRKRCRIFLWSMNALFLGALLGLVFTRVRKCAPKTWWHHTRAVHCYSGREFAIATISADITSDSLLVLVPFFMLRRSGLATPHRRLLTAIFASCLLSSVVGAISAIFIFKVRHQQLTWGWVIQFTSNIKAAVTLSVCNFLVVVTFIYRKLRSGDDQGDSGTSDTESSKIETREQPPPHSIVSYDRSLWGNTSIQTDSFRDMSTIFEPRPPRPPDDSNSQANTRADEGPFRTMTNPNMTS